MITYYLTGDSLLESIHKVVIYNVILSVNLRTDGKSHMEFSKTAKRCFEFRWGVPSIDVVNNFDAHK